MQFEKEWGSLLLSAGCDAESGAGYAPLAAALFLFLFFFWTTQIFPVGKTGQETYYELVSFGGFWGVLWTEGSSRPLCGVVRVSLSFSVEFRDAVLIVEVGEGERNKPNNNTRNQAL